MASRLANPSINAKNLVVCLINRAKNFSSHHWPQWSWTGGFRFGQGSFTALVVVYQLILPPPQPTHNFRIPSQSRLPRLIPQLTAFVEGFLLFCFQFFEQVLCPVVLGDSTQRMNPIFLFFFALKRKLLWPPHMVGLCSRSHANILSFPGGKTSAILPVAAHSQLSKNDSKQNWEERKSACN